VADLVWYQVAEDPRRGGGCSTCTCTSADALSTKPLDLLESAIRSAEKVVRKLESTPRWGYIVPNDPVTGAIRWLSYLAATGSLIATTRPCRARRNTGMPFFLAKDWKNDLARVLQLTGIESYPKYQKCPKYRVCVQFMHGPQVSIPGN
jgi:hypothetical protein